MRGLIRRRSVIINDRLPFQRCLDESIVRRLKASHEPEVQPSLARQLRPLIQDVASALITPRDANLSLFIPHRQYRIIRPASSRLTKLPPLRNHQPLGTLRNFFRNVQTERIGILAPHPRIKPPRFHQFRPFRCCARIAARLITISRVNSNRQRLPARFHDRVFDGDSAGLESELRPTNPAQPWTFKTVINMKWGQADRDVTNYYDNDEKQQSRKNAFEERNRLTSATKETQSL